MQYEKDRTECFDDYFPCRLRNCKVDLISFITDDLFIIVFISGNIYTPTAIDLYDSNAAIIDTAISQIGVPTHALKSL